MSPKFTRRIENFVCEHCGESIIGNGYTNHCHACLWSKHVDVYPGDREASCGGMMEPHAVEGTTTRLRIVHRCQKCGIERRNDVSDTDNKDAIIELVKKRSQAL